MTEVENEIIEALDFDYSVQCDHCNRDADWHATRICCGGDMFPCDPHWEEEKEYVEAWGPLMPLRCPECNTLHHDITDYRSLYRTVVPIKQG